MKKIINYPFLVLRRIYDWTLSWAHKKSSSYALFGIAFAESSFFPVPPDVLLIPLVAADPKNWWKKAAVCTLGSVCGVFLGYLIGVLFYETVGVAIINFYNLQEAIKMVGEKYADNAFVTVLIASFTPIPDKVVNITAGMFRISLAVLLFASFLGKGLRYFLVASVIRVFGGKVQYSIEKYFNVLSAAFVVVLVLGFVAVKYLL